MSDTRTLPPDIEIARRHTMQRVGDIAAKLGIPDDALEGYGKYKAKVSLDFYRSRREGTPGKLVLVT
ncbi:MAG: formate--tetrahydrofolate ligase, partial [Patescibacteria group bacterium]|nr:formate--tetrahydrofolate ligase [Patescibacteria group bacterium]